MTMKKALALALCFAMLLIPLTGAFANQTEVTPAPIETEQPQVETQQPEKSEPTQETTPIATQKSADDGAAVVSEESSETQEPDPTQESTPEATQETTPEATQESTPEATQETTPEATQETTPEATQETTPEASVDPSQDPSAEPSVDPSQDPSAEPSVDPSQDPSAEPSVDPSQDPSAEPSVDPSQDPSAEPSVDPSQDPSVEPSVDPSQDPSAEPSVDPSQDPSAEPSVDPTQQPLNPVVLTAGQRYAVVSEQAMSYTAAISGGVAPYHVSFDVTLGGTCVYGETVELAEAGDVSMRYAPDFNGDHVVTVIVTDGAGQTANQSAVMPVADWSVVENEEQWKKSVEDAELTGEWREDILAIARTQLGYAESDVNFEIDENGNRAGYTRYGHMFHNSRAEWCVMFVSFCLKYADITEYEVPYEGNSAILKDKLDYLGAYEENEDRFDPQPGDFVFFNWDEEESDVPQHVAIVEKVSGDTLHYIEGNMNARVQRN